MSRKNKWIAADSPEQPAVEVAAAALKNRLSAMWRCLPLAAEHADDDVEYVHQLRVSSRRAMIAVETFACFMPERQAQWFQKKVRKVRRAAGAARDLDVLAVRLHDRFGDDASPGVQELLACVAMHRREAQPAIRKIYRRLRERDFRRRSRKLLAKLAPRDPEIECEPDFLTVARRGMRKVADAFFDAAQGNLADVAQLHLFRIAGKELRYALEIFAAAFGPELVEQVYPQIVELQERIGAVNDHAAACAEMTTWSDRLQSSEAQSLLRQLIAEETHARDQALAAFPQFWTPDRKQRLRHQLQRELGDVTLTFERGQRLEARG